MTLKIYDNKYPEVVLPAAFLSALNARKRYPTRPEKPECPREPHNPQLFTTPLSLMLSIFALVFVVPAILILKDLSATWVAIYVSCSLGLSAFFVHDNLVQQQEYINSMKEYAENVKLYEQALEKYQQDFECYEKMVRALNTKLLQTYRKERLKEVISEAAQMRLSPCPTPLTESEMHFLNWIKANQQRFEVLSCVQVEPLTPQKKKTGIPATILLHEPACDLYFKIETVSSQALLTTDLHIHEKLIIIRFSERQTNERPNTCLQVIEDICDSLSKRYEFVVQVDDNFVENH